jgi:hypothetical protein
LSGDQAFKQRHSERKHAKKDPAICIGGSVALQFIDLDALPDRFAPAARI